MRSALYGLVWVQLHTTGILGVLPAGFDPASHEGEGMKEKVIRMARVQLDFRLED